ncbi:MAG: formate dehydrogenase accessory sulfurtransferase FdhD [Euzebya sp.]
MTPARTSTSRTKVRRYSPADTIGGRATLAVEEPLEIRIDGAVVATTMRTPGNDFDLALGFAITDAALDPDVVAGMSYCGNEAGEVTISGAAADLSGPYRGDFNIVNVATHQAGGATVHRHRIAPISSACGICGADVIADLTQRAGSVAEDRMQVRDSTVVAIPQVARASQQGFEATGATHAAAAFTSDGALTVLREDVGRHNAVDKVIGALASEQALPATSMVLFTSGRVAFEIVAKALIARFAMIVAVSAPTSLAVQTAEAAGLTLVGFARGEDFTVYTHPQRVITSQD